MHDGHQDARQGANHRKHRGADGDGLEALEHPHGGHGREDDQGRDQQRAHQVHGQHDDDGDDHGDEQVVGLHPGAAGAGEVFIEGDGKDLVVKQDEDGHHHHGQGDAEPHFRLGQGQNGGGAEQRGANVAGQIGRGAEKVEQQIADGHGAHRDQRDGGVALDTAVLARPQQQDGAQDGDGHGEKHVVRQMQHARHSHGREGHVGQAVADEGKALEHQGDAQERGTQGDEHAHDQRIAHKGKLQIHLNGLKHGPHPLPPPGSGCQWRCGGIPPWGRRTWWRPRGGSCWHNGRRRRYRERS